MSQISKFGLWILIGFLLSKTINENDFLKIKNVLINKVNDLSPELNKFFIDITNITMSNENDFLSNDSDIKNKILQIKNDLEKNNNEEIADLIISNLNKKEDHED